MSEVKVQFKVGSLEFSGEGDKDWLSTQLDKIIANAATLIALSPVQPPTAPQGSTGTHSPMSRDPGIAAKTLAAFLKEKSATTSQVKKFLATAVWLEAKGQNRLTTGNIAKALKVSSQTRIGNPSDSLAQNISKGFCERDGKEFFVTDEGKNSL